MSNTLETALKISVAQTGLENLTALIGELKRAGVETDAFEKEAAGLGEELRRLAAESGMVDAFKALKLETQAAEKAMADAKARVAELAREQRAAGGASEAQERAFAKARTVARDAIRAYEDKRAALHKMRVAMRDSGIASTDLALHQTRLRKVQEDLARRGEALTVQLRSSAEAAKVNAAAAERASKAWQIFRTGLGAGLGFAAAQLGVGGITATLHKLREGILDVARVGGQFEALRVQLQTLYGTAEQADQAFAWIKRFTSETPFELEQVTQGFIKLKAMGMDPMDGTFQAIADQASALGASGETLNGIVLALGQAWSKQKLQGEEALQLIERGVPVWDLMSRATGKTTAELQDLSAKGLLGRDAIRALVEEMGRMNAGAAERAMQTLNGQIANLKDNWASFLNLIAESGALEFFSEELKAINAAIKEMEETGELKVWAKEAADAIRSIGEAIKSGVLFVAEYGDALITLGKIAIGLKALAIGKTMLGWGADALTAAGMVRTGLAGMTGAATTAAGTLATIGKVLRALPWLAVAAEAGVIIARLIELREQSRKLKEAEAEADASAKRLSEAYAELSVRTGVAVSNSREFADAVKAGTLVFDQAKGSWEAAAPALDKVSKSARAFAEELVKADAAKLIAQFDEIIKKGGDVESALKKIAEGLEFGSPDKVAAFARALADLAETGRIGAVEMESAWRSALSALNGVQFNDFALNLKAAFDDGKISAAAFARVNDEVLVESFRRLGLSAEDALGKVSPAARAALQSLETIRLGLAGLSADGKTKMDLLGRAITAALSRADTRAALIELRQKIVDMGQAGDIASADLANSLAKVDAKLREVVGGATNAGNAITERMKEAADALAKSREETKQLRDAMRGTADAADRAGDAAKRAGEETEKAGKKAEEVRASFAEPFLQGEAAASRFAAEAQRIGEEVFSARMAATRVATIESWSAALNTAYDLAQRKALDYIRTMEDLDRREQAINSNASRGVEDLKFRLLELEGSEKEIAAARKARDVAEVQRSIELTRLELRRAQLRGDRAEIERLEAEIRLMNEQLVLIEKIHKAEARQREGKSTKSGGGAGMSGGGGAEVSAPGVRPQVNIVVNNTIEGLLDVQDRGSLDQLGRRLAPIWADLQRRGAF